jgi:methyl-accepting chemotaxis protein
LARVRDLSRGILASFSQLRNTVSTFRTLCTLTRIESSRLGAASAAFGNLANEVKPLSASIEAGGEVILEAYSRLEESVEAALRRCSSLQAQQLVELPALIAGVQDALGSLEERREAAYQTSIRQAGQYRAMGESIGKLVTSLQIHDITRQQIEHVTHALEQLLQQTSGSLPSNAPPVLRLQSQQLLSAGRIFGSSIGEIETDLDDIESRAREMAEGSRGLVEASGDERHSFFNRMEDYFKLILDVVAAVDRESLELQSTAAGLEQTIARMSAAVGEIRQIEIRIQRIAINAAIGAIHIGSSGRALSVIAEAMQSLAQESNANTESAAEALEQMREAAQRVSGSGDAAFETRQADPNDALEAMRAALAELKSSSESSFDRVHHIAAAGAQLSAEIAALRGGFSAGPLFSGVVTQVRDDIDRMVEEAFPGASEQNQIPHAQELDTLAKQYTMQSERDIHESLIKGSLPGSPMPETAPIAARDENDLGDNVELF